MVMASEIQAIPMGKPIDSAKQKELIIESSQIFAEACDGQVDDARELINRIWESEKLKNRWLLHDGGLQFQAIAGARWAVNGFPQVTLGSRHAAALAATKIPPEVLATVRSPWNAWLLELPQDVLLMSDEDGAPSPIRRLLVAYDEQHGWSFAAFAACHAGLHRWSVPVEKFVEAAGDVERWDDYLLFPAPTKTSIDDRAMGLCGRVIIGVALEMAARTHVLRQPKGPAPRWRKRTPGAPEISCRTYVLKADVRVDCREGLRDYLLGRRSSAPAVQHLVRGHWKLQAHGPKMAERKLIWVQPYWRGPEDAPIAVRAHVASVEKDKEHGTQAD